MRVDSNFVYNEHQNYLMMQLQMRQLAAVQSAPGLADMTGGFGTISPQYILPSTNNAQQLWQEHSTFNSFQEQMRSAQQFQRAQLQSAFSNLSNQYSPYTGVIGPSAGLISGLPQQLLQSQLQGIYSGLGITPEARQLFSQYVVSPIRNQAAQTMSLSNAFLTTAFSRAPLGMSFEQQEYLANTLSSALVNRTNDITGAAANLAGGAAGLWGAAKIAGRFGFLPVAIGTGVALAGDKVLSSSWGPALTGGAFGGYNPAYYNPFKWFGHMREELTEDEMLTNLFNRESYRFLDSSARRSPYNLGLTREDTREWATAVRHWDTKFNMSDAEIQGILGTVIDNDLIKGVADFEEFEDKFSEQVKYIRNASKILNKSYQEVADMIAEFKRAGIQPGNFDLMAAELKNYSAILGKSVDTVKGFMLNSVGAITQGTGLSPELTGQQILFNSAIMQRAYDIAKDTGDEEAVNLINNFGGAMGASNAVRTGFTQILSRQDVASLAANFYTPLGNGEFEFNQEAFERIYQGVKSGSLTARDLTDGMRSWHPSQQIPFLQAARSGQLMLNQDEHTVMRQMQALVGMFSNSPQFAGMTDANVMSVMFGLDPNVATLTDLAMDTYETEGPKVAISTYFNSRSLLSAAEQENLKKDLLRGNYLRTTEWLDSLVENSPLGLNLKYSVEDYLQDSINRKAGIGSINLAEHKLSGTSYNFDIESLEQVTVDKVEQERKFQSQIRDFVSRHKEIIEVDGTLDLGDLMGSGISAQGIYELAKKAEARGSISKWELMKVRGATNEAVISPSSVFDRVSTDLVWKTLIDKSGNLVDVSGIEGGNELVTRLVYQGAKNMEERLPRVEALELQKTLVDSLALEMKEALAMEDRAAIAQQAGIDLYSFIESFDLDVSKLGNVTGFGALSIDTKALAAQQGAFQRELHKITRDAPKLTEEQLGKRIDDAFNRLVVNMGQLMPGGEDHLAAYFKTKLYEEAEHLNPLVNQLGPEAIKDFNELVKLIGGLKDLQDIPEILQERALFAKAYGLGAEEDEATDILDKTKSITEKYKEATDEYYNLIEDRITDLNTRINALEFGSDDSGRGFSLRFAW